MLATRPPRVRFALTAQPERYARRQSRVVIRHVSGDPVVAVVEIVSPGNKASRHALQSFVEKAVKFIEAGIHLLLLDLFPPGPRDPQEIHAVLWSEFDAAEFVLPKDQPLTLAAYSSGELKRAFVEPVAIGTILPEMPLFLAPEWYIVVPLEQTYAEAFAAVPARWREVLEPRAGATS